jgi:hypothetical protein
MAFVSNSPSFRSADVVQLENAGEGVNALVLSGIDGDTPVYVLPSESGYVGTALAASTYGIVGVPERGSIASGAVGVIRIKGYRAGVQGSAAAFKCEKGHSIAWAVGTLFATSSAMTGSPGQVGVCAEAGLDGSTTANIYLTGVHTTAIAGP